MTDLSPFEETLQAARRGEPAALERIYRALAPAVLGYLRGRGAAEPEDVASETFVGVVRGLARFEGEESSFRSWVFSIAHRRMVDERRRLARRREDPVDPAGLPEGRARSADAAEEALARMAGEDAARLLAPLTEEQRDVVLLRVLGGLTTAETAAALGMTEGAVKAASHRALRALARRLEVARIPL